MHPFLLLAALTLAPAPPIPPAPQGEVTVQARRIVLPHMPASVAQAHAEYGQVGPSIRSGLEDLEQDLLRLYGEETGPGPMPATLEVPATEADAAAFFARMLHDVRFKELQKAVFATWNDWQAFLVEEGLATAEGPRPAAKGKDDPELRKDLARRRAESAAWLEDDRKQALYAAEEVSAGGGHEVNVQGYNFLHEASVASETRDAQAIRLKVVADRKAPSFAASWNPMVDYLNDCAGKLADLEHPAVPYQHEDMLRLKRRATIAFLERCRTTLWLSQKAWALLTTTAGPAPLKNLRPR